MQLLIYTCIHIQKSSEKLLRIYTHTFIEHTHTFIEHTHTWRPMHAYSDMILLLCCICIYICARMLHALDVCLGCVCVDSFYVCVCEYPGCLCMDVCVCVWMLDVCVWMPWMCVCGCTIWYYCDTVYVYTYVQLDVQLDVLLDVCPGYVCMDALDVCVWMHSMILLYIYMYCGMCAMDVCVWDCLNVCVWMQKVILLLHWICIYIRAIGCAMGTHPIAHPFAHMYIHIQYNSNIILCIHAHIQSIHTHIQGIHIHTSMAHIQ